MTRKLTIKEFCKIALTFGLKGDYYLLRQLTLKYKFIFYPLYKLYEAFHGAYLPLTNKMEGYVDFVHKPYSCFLSMNCQIGKNCVIMQQVTIGSNHLTKGDLEGGSPVIGDNVFIGAGAQIIGSVKIGNNVKIGAGAVVIADIPSNSTAVGVPAKVVISKV